MFGYLRPKIYKLRRKLLDILVAGLAVVWQEDPYTIFQFIPVKGMIEFEIEKILPVHNKSSISFFYLDNAKNT
jgi:hypothetical protein